MCGLQQKSGTTAGDPAPPLLHQPQVGGRPRAGDFSSGPSPPTGVPSGPGREPAPVPVALLFLKSP